MEWVKLQRGFTTVELAVVLMTVVVLFSFGVPRFRDAVERTHAGEAVQYLIDVRLAQDLHRGALGHFAKQVSDLELTAPDPQYFKVGPMRVWQGVEIGRGWSLTLTRHADTSDYGAYTVTFNQRGYDVQGSSLSSLSQVSPIEGYALLQP